MQRTTRREFREILGLIHDAGLENEVGQVVRKQGRFARALRTILAAIAMKEKRRFELDIATGSAPHPALQIGEVRT